MRRAVSVWLPNWPITRLRLREGPGARPADRRACATVETIEGIRRLAAVDETARAKGLRPGQSVPDACAILPDLVTIDAAPEDDRAALDRLARWCGRFTPSAAADAPDGLWLDITGCAHLWGGEQALAQDLTARLRGRGIPCRIAIAGGFAAAWALARFGAAADGITVLAPGDEARRVAALPVAALRIAPELLDGPHRLGLRRIEQLTALPRRELGRRFGQDLLRRLDQLTGDAEDTVAFAQPPTPWLARWTAAEPIAAAEDLARVAAMLADQLCARLATADHGAKRFEAAFHRVDGAVMRIAVGLALPSRAAPALTRLLTDRLEQIDPGFGIDAVTLAAGAAEPLAAAQRALPDHQPGSNPSTLGDAAADLAPLIDSLGNRLGFARLWRVAPVESHVPERAVARVAPLPLPRSVPDRRWPQWQVRPIRLLRRPEPIDVIAPVPDDPPIQFRWGRIAHRVRRADGPERIAFEWWRTAPEDRDAADLIRDYYRVEDHDGGRFWIYRAGLYAPNRPARWYLHGFFA